MVKKAVCCALILTEIVLVSKIRVVYSRRDDMVRFPNESLGKKSF